MDLITPSQLDLVLARIWSLTRKSQLSATYATTLAREAQEHGVPEVYMSLVLDFLREKGLIIYKINRPKIALGLTIDAHLFLLRGGFTAEQYRYGIPAEFRPDNESDRKPPTSSRGSRAKKQ